MVSLFSFFIRCWDQDPNMRPSMDYVVSYMSKLINFFGNYDLPIEDLSGLPLCILLSKNCSL